MFKERYQERKKELLEDASIIKANRHTIKTFLEYQETKLKRKQGLSDFDERSAKTLYFYIGRLINLNKWFNNRDWSKLSYNEIKKFVDNLEDGIIRTRKNTRFADRSLYYQMIQGKLFKLAGVDIHAKTVFDEFEIRGRNDSDNEVRFIREDVFRKIVNCVIQVEQKCLMWLAFDIGENIGTLLELTTNDFERKINTDSNEPEYAIRLSRDKIKRSRTARTEITNYKETVQFLDIVLSNVKPVDKVYKNKFNKKIVMSDLHDDDKLFKFGLMSARRFLNRAVEKVKAKCEPSGQNVTWKDLRSSMACDLLSKEWNRDEVNSRLGHKPSSRIIDRYINYLAIDKSRPKKKIYENNLRKIEGELENAKEQNKLQNLRIENQKNEMSEVKKQLLEMQKNYDNLYSAMAVEELENGKVISDIGMKTPLK